jgi:hypothetical protein
MINSIEMRGKLASQAKKINVPDHFNNGRVEERKMGYEVRTGKETKEKQE